MKNIRTFVIANNEDMAKDKIAYVCSNCGQESAKWVGKCPSCGQWNTFSEIRISGETGSMAAKQAAANVHKAMSHSGARPMLLRDISSKDEPRIDTHDTELNRVLGGGLVKGSIVLLGGEPGIGKSTLTLQTILNMPEKRILYVSGEESAHQLKMRAERICKELTDNVMVLCETSLDDIFHHISDVKPEFVVIDSIQTISTADVDSSPGSLSQVRECASALLRFAKSSGVPVLLIGHITKEGTLAGPKILEHIVDTVIQFEGDNHYMYRILRSTKNRFGSTSELGIYEMQQQGLRQVSNPSELLLSQDHAGHCHQLGHRGCPSIPCRDSGLSIHGCLRHTTTLGNRLRPAAPQHAARRAGEEGRLQARAEGCLHQHCRRTARHRPCHGPQRYSSRAVEQCRHGNRDGMVYGWRSGIERRGASREQDNATHC